METYGCVSVQLQRGTAVYCQTHSRASVLFAKTLKSRDLSAWLFNGKSFSLCPFNLGYDRTITGFLLTGWFSSGFECSPVVLVIN